MQRAGKSYVHAKKTVCVLAGDSAGDAVYSERHKVRCVAIDYDISNVETFRAAGGVAVQDSLKNQILALTPDCVIADCVNGITVDNIALLLEAITVCDAVVLNLLRGRDPVGGEMVKQMSGLTYVVPHYKGGCVVEDAIEKHRGKMVFHAMYLIGCSHHFTHTEAGTADSISIVWQSQQKTLKLNSRNSGWHRLRHSIHAIRRRQQRRY